MPSLRFVKESPFARYLANNVPVAVLCGGIKVGFIPVLYGIGIYIVSLIIRIVQKPRI